MGLRGKKRKPTKVLLIMGGVFLVAGVLTGSSAVRELLDASASRAWPSVSGEVVSSEVRTQRSGRSGRSRGRSRTSRSKTTHRAEIRYEYTVEGQHYTADRVLFGGHSSGSSSYANEVMDRYPKGKQIVVYYDPTQPDQAVLEPGVTGGVYIQLAGGGLFAVVGAGLCFAGVRLSRTT